MSFFDYRSATGAAAMALLAACGGASPNQLDATGSTAVLVQGPAPLADCEVDGCRGPRIVDGLAEQYRAAASVAADAPPEEAPR